MVRVEEEEEEEEEEEVVVVVVQTLHLSEQHFVGLGVFFVRFENTDLTRLQHSYASHLTPHA
jgi:hypothetical protein